jgi:hypothetical protein
MVTRQQVFPRTLITPQRQRRLGKQEVCQLITARQSGDTIDALAQRFAVHRTSAERRKQYPARMARPVPTNPSAPVDVVDDGLTEAEIAERVAHWLDELEKEPIVTLDVTAAQELEAARRDDDL